MLALVAAAAVALPGLNWRNIGPALAGGRTAAVAGSDADPYLYYFGSAGGGVYKTTTGGLTWTQPWPKSAVGAIGAIAISSSNRNVVWVGTGEPNPRNDASYGDGVWLTRDGGATWSHRGLTNSYAISKILVDPRDANVALAGALGNPFVDSRDRGVYRTTDGGRTWTQTLYAGPQSGISDLSWDPHDPLIVYAGVWQFRRVPWTFASGGPIDGLYKSVDGGKTWRKLTGNGLPTDTIGRIGVAIAPSDPRRVYALIQSKQGLLWRSDDAGAHWRMMSKDSLIDQRPFYMSRLAVDPSNRDRVFFASENIAVTNDGGKSFIDVHSAVHQDHHDFWISHDGRRIIEADDGGAPISIDGGKTWDWRFNVDIGQIYHVGYDEQTPYHVCAALQDNDTYCGPNISLSPLGLTERDWRDVANDADGVWVWPEPGNPNSVWNVGINELNGQLGIFDLDSRQNYDITPYVRDTNGRKLEGLPYRFNWEAPLAFSYFWRKPAFDEHNGVGPSLPPELLAYFGANVVFLTGDRGRTWTPISPDLTRNDPSKQQLSGGPINTDISGAEFYDTLLDIAPSPLNSPIGGRRVIWTGSDDGVVSMTSDSGSTWTNVTPRQIPPWGRVEAVEPSRANVGRAYAVVNRHAMGDRHPYILVTDDGGATWRSISNGLPQDEPAHVIREDLLNPDVLYAGLEQGAYYSLDRGARWHSLRLGLSSVSFRDLRIQPDTNDLIAGTHGAGIYILDDLTPFSAVARDPGHAQLLVRKNAYTWYVWWEGQYGTHDDECCVPAGTFSGQDAPYGAMISYYLPAKAPKAPSIDITDSSGKLVRHLDGLPAGAGINRTAWDLLEEPIVPWNGTGEWNAAWSAPMVVPGNYTIALHAGSVTLTQPLAVAADPRAKWTQADYVARHAFLTELAGELSQTDEALNDIDAQMKRASPARRRALQRVKNDFTSGVVNAEDDQLAPDAMRERLTILLGVVNLSQGPPLPPHLKEAAEIKESFDRAMAAYHVLKEERH